MAVKADPILSQALLDAQTGVLGSMLIDADTVGPVMARTTAKDFRSPQHRLVYEAIRRLFDRGAPVDGVSVNAELGGNASAFLVQLMELTPTAANCDEYVALLKQSAALDELRILGERLSDAKDLDAARGMIEQAGTILSERNEIRVVSAAQGLSDFISRHSVQWTPNYLSWEFGLADYLFVEPGDFVIIGARPSVGKTSFAMQQAFLQAQTKRVGFFSLETSDKKLIDRLVANRGEISFESIKRHSLTDAACEMVAHMSKTWAGSQLDIIPASGLTVSDVRAISLSHRYEVIYIDYLQLLSSPSGAKQQSSFDRVSQISKDLHAFSQGTGTTVVALSQLSRGERLKNGKEPPPQLSDLRESGQIEQDADVVIFLFKENPGFMKSRRVLKVAKNKDGLAGAYQMLDFDGDHQRFRKSMAIYRPPEAEKPKEKQINLFRPEPEDPNAPF